MYLWSCAQPTKGKKYYKNICKKIDQQISSFTFNTLDV